MRKGFIVIAIMGIISSCGQRYISPGELDIILHKNDIVIVDLRNEKKYADGHIKGAVSAEYHEATFIRDITTLDRKSEIILYCGEGIKSDKAASLMKEKGFKSIKILRGGYSSWVNAGFSTER